MTISTTANVDLALPSHLGESGTWDTPLNNNFGYLDSMYGSVTALSLTASGTTLSIPQCQVAVIRVAGTLLANVTVTLTSTIKAWVVENTTLGNFNVTVSGGSGNAVCAPPGSSQMYWDGTNMSFINMGQIGQYMDIATTVTPTWITSCSVPPYLVCDGSSFSAVSYPILNKILGGNTLPDFRGRARFFADGGTNRITVAGSNMNGTTLFATGGSQNVTITRGNLPNDNLLTGANVSITNGTGVALGQHLGNQGAAGGIYGVESTTTLSIAGSIWLNNNVTQTATYVMPPAAIGGITMIRAA